MARSVVELQARTPELEEHLKAAIGTATVGICLDTEQWRCGAIAQLERAIMGEPPGLPIVGEGVHCDRAYRTFDALLPEDAEQVSMLAADAASLVLNLARNFPG
jgi:hypothetical protein